MQCYCFLRSVTDIIAVSGGKTSYELRYNTPFKGPRIPFGASLDYKPPNKDGHGSHHLPGFFVGYDTHAGGRWNGDLLVVDKRELMERSTARKVHIRRFKEKEVFPHHLESGRFLFPLIQGDIPQPRRLFRREIIWEPAPFEPVAAREGTLEEHLQDYFGDPDETPPNRDLTDYPLTEPDSWKITPDVVIRIHNQPRTKTFVPTEENCPLPLHYLDVMRKTDTTLPEAAQR